MNWLKRASTFLFGDYDDEDEQQEYGASTSQPSRAPGARPRSHAAEVQHEPVLVEAGLTNDGGVQGLSWYAARLQQDQHGDLSHEFLNAEAEGSRGGGGGGRKKAPKAAANQACVTGRASLPLRVERVERGSVVVR